MARFIDIASGYPLELPDQPVTFGSAADNTIPIAEAFGLSAGHDIRVSTNTSATPFFSLFTSTHGKGT